VRFSISPRKRFFSSRIPRIRSPMIMGPLLQALERPSNSMVGRVQWQKNRFASCDMHIVCFKHSLPSPFLRGAASGKARGGEAERARSSLPHSRRRKSRSRGRGMNYEPQSTASGISAGSNLLLPCSGHSLQSHFIMPYVYSRQPPAIDAR
jgi:hypothetical protein